MQLQTSDNGGNRVRQQGELRPSNLYPLERHRIERGLTLIEVARATNLPVFHVLRASQQGLSGRGRVAAYLLQQPIPGIDQPP